MEEDETGLATQETMVSADPLGSPTQRTGNLREASGTPDGYDPLAEELRPDEWVDHFQVIRLIGRGGMGEVYLARDTKLGRRVALKRLSLQTTQDWVERFQFEAQTTAQFSHPNIVTVYAVGTHKGTPYLALEYLEGQTLRERMHEGRFGPREVMRLGLAMGEALKEAHSHDVLHRDLKPENVLLPSDGRPRVVDFGLAARLTNTSGPSDGLADTTSADEGLFGTPAYMAPEQWQQATLDAAVDIWALGTVLYELLSGRHPYPDLSHVGFAFALAQSTPVPPCITDAVNAEELTAFVGLCLKKQPNERPTANEVVLKLRKMLETAALLDRPESNPFRGLLPFTDEHADFFFGRDPEIAQCVEQLRRQAMIAVTGPSGAGKSSFVMAGVLTRLRENDRWIILRMRPGSRPFATLAQRIGSVATPGQLHDSGSLTAKEGVQPAYETEGLARSLRKERGRLALELRSLARLHQARVLLFVDQLEELVTLSDDDIAAAHFMESLAQAGDEPLDPVRIILTVRDDFVSRLAASPSMRTALTGMFFLNRPGAKALEDVVRRPVQAMGYDYDDENLPADIVRSVKDEPSCLPLLQFASEQLWEARDTASRRLLRAEYERMGGVLGALAQHANGVLSSLLPREMSVAKALLLRLVTGDRTRQVMPRSELLGGLSADAIPVLERLTTARLLTVRKGRDTTDSTGTVELAHESLITSWRTLAEWLDEAQDDLSFISDAGLATDLWEKRGRRDEDLWHGDSLHDANRHIDRMVAPLPPKIRLFVEQSRKRQAKRARFNRMLFLSIVASLTLIVVVLLIQNHRVEQERTRATGQSARAQKQRALAESEKSRADHQRGIALEQRAAALIEGAEAAHKQGNILEARAKTRLALETHDSIKARLLWWQLLSDPMSWKRTFESLLQDVDFSPKGDQLVVVTGGTFAYTIDTISAEIRPLRSEGNKPISAAYNPNGNTLITGGMDGSLMAWDPKSSRVIRSIQGHKGSIRGLAFSPSGKFFVSSGNDKRVKIWKTATFELLGEFVILHASQAIDVHPDEDTVAIGTRDGRLTLWSIRTQAKKVALPGPKSRIYDLHFSPDGTRLATSHKNGEIQLWNTKTGDAGVRFQAHRGAASTLAFSPNGKLLVSGGYDRLVRIWDAQDGRQVAVFEGHTEIILGVDFAPSGKSVASSGVDASVRIWNVEQHQRRTGHRGHGAPVVEASYSPDGATIATGGDDSTIRLWDAETGQVKRVLRGHSEVVLSVAYSTDGDLIASGSLDGYVRLWDPATGKERRILAGHGAGIRDVCVDPKGVFVASASYDKSVRIWNMASGINLQVLKHLDSAVGCAFHPFKDRLASVTSDGLVHLWDTQTGTKLHEMQGHNGPTVAVAFSKTGDELFSSSADATVRVWNSESGAFKRSLELGARAGSIDTNSHTNLIGVPLSNGTSAIYPADGTKVRTLFRGHTRIINALSFSPDGTQAVTVSDDETVRTWNVSTGRPIWKAPLLTLHPPTLVTHRGPVPFGPSTGTPALSDAPETAWLQNVRKEGVQGDISPQGDKLCLHTYQNALEIWDIGRDKLLASHPYKKVFSALATEKGCLARAKSGDQDVAILVGYDGTILRLPMAGNVTALSFGQGIMYVAAGRDIHTFDADGKSRYAGSAESVVRSILALGSGGLMVGYDDGGLDFLPSTDSGYGVRSNVSFERTPASSVKLMASGPKNTVVVGYENGLLGIWSRSSGKRLITHSLHGPIEHLRLVNGQLFAASGLGDQLQWDLTTLYAPHCEVLQALWRKTPVVWKDGRPVQLPPPRKHRCRKPSYEAR
jgi:WD40 repeat protein/serine/threonine protein kinase